MQEGRPSTRLDASIVDDGRHRRLVLDVINKASSTMVCQRKEREMDYLLCFTLVKARSIRRSSSKSTMRIYDMCKPL